MEQVIKFYSSNPELFLIITVISAIFWKLALGDDNLAFLASFLSIGMGPLLLIQLPKLVKVVGTLLVILGILAGIAFLAGAVMGVAFEIKKSKKPFGTGVKAFSSTSHATGVKAFSSTSHPAPSRLFHGTPNLEWAADIVRYNRWRINRHSPHGVYMAEDFQTAKGYAGASGYIVEINVRIPSSLVIDINQIPKSSDQVINQGYRLIRNKNIYIAPIPEIQSNGEYFRVEGIVPVRVLDNYQNPLSILTA